MNRGHDAFAIASCVRSLVLIALGGLRRNPSRSSGWPRAFCRTPLLCWSL